MEKGKIYLFYRGDYFYPIELRDDKDAIENAEYNIGTTKVENTDGIIIWKQQPQQP